jgi:excisionase family DNA binding protein
VVTTLAAALLAELDDAALDQLAALLAPRLNLQSTESETSWLGVKAAAEYLACPTSRIYALTNARRIPFHKDGSRTLFHRAELDEWVRAGGGKRP